MKKKILCVPDFAFEFDMVRGHIVENGLYLDRDTVETNFAYRQIIPYIVVRNTDGKILTYKRQPRSSEDRLQGQYTIGVGGHVEQSDGNGWVAVMNAAKREVQEEIGVVPILQGRDIIVIRLHETLVDRAHLGLGIIMDSWEGEIQPSKEVPTWEWKTPEELETMQLETWSRYMLETRFLS